MNEPQINVDHFYHRPTFRVVGLLSERSEIPTLSGDLATAGVDVSAVAGAGIDVDALAERLQRQGAGAFSADWASLLTAIEEKAQKLKPEASH